MALSIRSGAFENGAAIPRRHTGDGEDVSPPLEWSGVPDGTVELALFVDDPDAPVAEPWVHWVLCKLSPTISGLPAGFHGDVVPVGQGGLIQGRNSWGTIGYRGPAPPRGHGVHHYGFRLFALDAPLPVVAGVEKNALVNAMDGHIVARAKVVGTYRR